MSHTGATGFEPAVFGLTGRHVNRYTTPPDGKDYSTALARGQIRTAHWETLWWPLPVAQSHLRLL